MPRPRMPIREGTLTRRYVLCCALALVAALTSAQEITTAQQFFQRVSEAFGGVNDYSCRFTLTRGDTVSTGSLYYKKPNLLRLDYATPAGQAILSDGKDLWVYIPSANLLLHQELKSRSAAELESMASAKALRMFQDGYDISYLDQPGPVALGPDSTEQVTKLRLTRSSSREMYREIILSIGPNMLIRRLEGTLEDHTEIVMDYANIRVNQGVPNSRFQEDDWADAAREDNFLTGGN